MYMRHGFSISFMMTTIPGFELDEDKYVIAVSGGVDSMTLLDMIYKQQGAESIIAAYFDHQQRDKDQIAADISVIRQYCKQRNIQFITNKYTGLGRSEADLRRARYDFLFDVLTSANYNKIITAHHKNDLLETALINILRGTYFRGLNSIANEGVLIRPLLKFWKYQLVEYANENNLTWHEDITNSDQTILRNYVRYVILPRIEAAGKTRELYRLIDRQRQINNKIDDLMPTVMRSLSATSKEHTLNRQKFICTPHLVSMQVMNDFIKTNTASVEIATNKLLKIVIFAKTAKPDRSIDISSGYRLGISSDSITLISKHL